MNGSFSTFLLLTLGTLACTANGQEATITHGPMLGRLTESSVRVWVRTSRPADVVVKYGKSEKDLSQTSKSVRTRLDDDNTAWVELSGLEPGVRYHYRPMIRGNQQGKPGSFRTLSSPQKRKTKLNPKGLYNFRFEFACGNNQNPEHGNGPSLPTYTTMLREVMPKIDFAILNGDWLYEEKRDYSPEQWRRQVGLSAQQLFPRTVRVAPTTVGIWENYKTYLARADNLSKWHRHIPTYFTFDDHEIVNDVYGSGQIGRKDRRAVFRDIAINAWYDYLGWSNPTHTKQDLFMGRCRLQKGSGILVDPQADFSKVDWSQAANLHVHWGRPFAGRHEAEFDNLPGDPNAGVYKVVKVLDKNRLEIEPKPPATGMASYSIGRHSYGKFRVSNCEFYLLDTRTHRQMHDVRAPMKPGVSMLGKQQYKWLTESMANSDADFHFVVSSVNFMIPHVGGGGVAFDVNNKDDAWTVFLEEREKLIKFWDGLGKPVFVLTGDLHNSFAIKITDRVWEFASGPHNSVNHRPTDEGDRPSTGRYQYGPRPCEIRWSSYCLGDIPRPHRLFPMYCMVQVNNVFNNPQQTGGTRWVAYPQPQVIFQYYDGRTGDLRYAESISLTGESPIVKRAWKRAERK